MAKALIWTIGILAALGALAFGARKYAARLMVDRAVTPKILGSASPANVGVPFARVAMDAGDRTLIGWWVRARADSGRVAPAVLFLHGNRSAISDYVELQRFFYRNGISSFVFDYSGFGASGGAPSLVNAIADASTAARVFADSAGPDARKVAMGAALGATVLLQAIDSVQPHVSGVVIEGTDASVLESAVRAGHVPPVLTRLLEEPADNVAAAARVRVPLLAVHSYDDARVPLADAQRVVAAVPARAALVRHWRRGHSALLASSRPCDWAQVLTFVRTGALPAAGLDTTNACAAEDAAIAAHAAADSARRAIAAESAAARGATTKAGTTTGPRASPAGTDTSATTGTAPPTKRP